MLAIIPYTRTQPRVAAFHATTMEMHSISVDFENSKPGVSWLEFYAFDATYLDKLRSGDDATEQHFVRYFTELITLKLRSRLQSPQAIQDVQQETFARAFRLLRTADGVRHGERLGSLMNSICNHVLFESYRSSKQTQPLEDAVAATLLHRGPDALRELISGETATHVHDVLDSLGGRDRLILRAVFVQERDKDEVCEELGINREYMRVLIHRAKHAFRERYQPKQASSAAPLK